MLNLQVVGWYSAEAVVQNSEVKDKRASCCNAERFKKNVLRSNRFSYKLLHGAEREGPVAKPTQSEWNTEQIAAMIVSSVP